MKHYTALALLLTACGGAPFNSATDPMSTDLVVDHTDAAADASPPSSVGADSGVMADAGMAPETSTPSPTDAGTGGNSEEASLSDSGSEPPWSSELCYYGVAETATPCPSGARNVTCESLSATITDFFPYCTFSDACHASQKTPNQYICVVGFVPASDSGCLLGAQLSTYPQSVIYTCPPSTSLDGATP